MTIRTEPFDPAQYLDTLESQAELLSDALKSGNTGYIVNALGVVARAQGITSIAGEALRESVSENGDPRLTTLLGVVRALGFKLAVHPLP